VPDHRITMVPRVMPICDIASGIASSKISKCTLRIEEIYATQCSGANNSVDKIDIAADPRCLACEILFLQSSTRTPPICCQPRRHPGFNNVCLTSCLSLYPRHSHWDLRWTNTWSYRAIYLCVEVGVRVGAQGPTMTDFVARSKVESYNYALMLRSRLVALATGAQIRGASQARARARGLESTDTRIIVE
jgi:hypothetical protein